MSNHAEILLSTVQHLRRHIGAHPYARGDMDTVEQAWLPGELFPPERSVLLQALNVLINAGELFASEHDNVTVYSAEAPLYHAAGY